MASIVKDAASATGSPSRGSGLPTALAITTSIVYDGQGRVTKITDPGGSVSYFGYFSDRDVQVPYWNGSAAVTPIHVTAFNNADQTTDDYDLDPGASGLSVTISSDQVSSLSGDTQSGRVHWTHYAYDSHGRLSTLQRYHLIPSGSSTAITNYYGTTLGYDAEGRVNDVVQDVGPDSSSTLRQQETQVKYDFMGRPFELDRGVIVGTTAATMVPVRKLEYDGGVVGSAQQVGDGYVTKIINYFGTGSNDYTGAVFHRTYRGHLRGVEPIDSSGTVTPITLLDVDWMGRQTANALLGANPTWTTILTGDGYATQAAASSQANRYTASTRAFDAADRLYRIQQYQVDSSNGNLQAALQSDLYYDQRNLPVALVRYKQAGVELAYDGAGRRYETRIVKALKGGDFGGSGFYSSGHYVYCDPQPAPSFGSGSTSALSGGNDGVIQFTHELLDAMGSTIEEHTFEVNHNDTDGINITSSGTQDYVRRSLYGWYDWGAPADDNGRLRLRRYRQRLGNVAIRQRSVPSRHGSQRQ